MVTATNEKVAICHRATVPESPDSYSGDTVQFVKDMIAEALNGIGGIEAFVQAGDSVVLKVNAGFRGSPGVHTTDPRVVEALTRLILEVTDPKEIIIAENAAERHFLDETGIGATTSDCFKSGGFEQVALKTGAKLLALEEDAHVDIQVPGAKVFPNFQVPRTILEADVLISIPHLKTHLATGVTLNLKLNQGVLPTRDKKRCHGADLSQKLVDILRVIRPHLSIIDGLWAQEGQGPTSPYERDIIRDMNVIIAGKDPVAVDAVGSAVMGFDPFEVKTTWIASRQGLGQGNLDKIDVIGNGIGDVSRHFKRPSVIVEEVFPKVQVHMGGACEGCITHLRMFLDYLHCLGLLNRLPEKIDVILGYNAVAHGLGKHVLIIGDCAVEHRNKGLFVEGCCPLSRILWGLLDLVSLMPCKVDALFPEEIPGKCSA